MNLGPIYHGFDPSLALCEIGDAASLVTDETEDDKEGEEIYHEDSLESRPPFPSRELDLSMADPRSPWRLPNSLPPDPIMTELMRTRRYTSGSSVWSST
jgi:hypothetical protein